MALGPAFIPFLLVVGALVFLTWAYPYAAIVLGVAIMIVALLTITHVPPALPLQIAIEIFSAGALLSLVAAVVSYRRRKTSTPRFR
jgi:hypothetical protein